MSPWAGFVYCSQKGKRRHKKLCNVLEQHEKKLAFIHLSFHINSEFSVPRFGPNDRNSLWVRTLVHSFDLSAACLSCWQLCHWFWVLYRSCSVIWPWINYGVAYGKWAVLASKQLGPANAGVEGWIWGGAEVTACRRLREESTASSQGEADRQALIYFLQWPVTGLERKRHEAVSEDV